MPKLTKSINNLPEVSKLHKASMALENIALALKEIRAEQLLEAADTVALLAKSTSVAGGRPRSEHGDPNKRYLVGVLPSLLQDKELFPQNDDIVEFASDALGLQMNRSEKRSRYEIIGKVICETEFLDGKRLERVVKALESAVGDAGTFEELKSRKRAGNFSWNETIQFLTRG